MEKFKIRLERIDNSPSEIDDDPQGDYKVFVDEAELMRLELTCHACPEQYDLISLLDGKKLSYMRLRWSYFKCEYPYDSDEIVYDGDVDDDGFSGRFHGEGQRVKFLSDAIKAVVKKIREEIEDGKIN